MRGGSDRSVAFATDQAFIVALRELAGLVSPERLASGAIYPLVTDFRRIAGRIADRGRLPPRDTGFGRQYRDAEIGPAVDRAMWWPYDPALAPADATTAPSRWGGLTSRRTRR
jgi:hypothetical protein